MKGILRAGSLCAAALIAATATAAMSTHVAAAGGITAGPILAIFDQANRLTSYKIQATDNDGRSLSYRWSLTPPAADPNCNHFASSGSTATWHHGDQNGCNHNVQVAQGHPGTVSVVVSDGQVECNASYFGTITGTGSQPICSALAATTSAPAKGGGVPGWLIAAGVVLALAVVALAGWLLLSARDPCAELRDRCRELQAAAGAASEKAAAARAAAAAAKKACSDAGEARAKAENRVKAATGEGGSSIEGTAHPGQRLTSLDLQLQSQFEASVRAQVESGAISAAQGQEMLSHWDDPAQWDRLRKEAKDGAQAALDAATWAERTSCAEAERLVAASAAAAAAAVAAQKAAHDACAAADECEKKQRERAAALAATPPPAPPPTPPAATPASAPSAPTPASSGGSPPPTQQRPDCADGDTRTEVRCETEVDMYNLAETTLVIDGAYQFSDADVEKAMKGLDHALTVIDFGTLAVNTLDTAGLALGAWVAGKLFNYPSFDTITSLPQDSALDGLRDLIRRMRAVRHSGTWTLRCNLYHFKATCTVTYTCQAGHWAVTDRKMNIQQVSGPTPVDSEPQTVLVQGSGVSDAQRRLWSKFINGNTVAQRRLDECARKCSS